VAGDYIIVVDASQSMKGFIKLPNKLGKLKPRNKVDLVKTQLVNYLGQIPDDGSRVYIMYFDVGIQKLNGKELATRFIFNAEGKKAAIAQAKKYGDIVSDFAFPNNTHLWSSFHKALEFAENEKYYRPADPNAGTPDLFPNIFLLSDGADNQQGAGKWAFKAPPLNPNMKQAVLNAHPWLPKQDRAIWYQLGVNLKVGWHNVIGQVQGPGQGHVELPLNPPGIILGGVQNKPLPGGGLIAQAKMGQPVQLTAKGDPRYVKYHWSYKLGKQNRNHSVPPNVPVIVIFKSMGFKAITLIGETKKGIRRDLTVEVKIQIVGDAPPAAIVAKFSMQTNGKPVPENKEVWAVKKAGILVSFVNLSMAKMDNKAIPANKLKYEWIIDGKKDLNQIPDPRLFMAGKHEISLKVSFGDPKALQVSKPFTQALTVRQFQRPVIGVAGLKPGADPVFEAGQPVVIQFVKPFPPGTILVIKSGDKQERKGTSQTQEVRFTYPKASAMKGNNPVPFQVMVKATLPGGESDDIPGPGIIIQKQAGELFISKKTPWMGEKIQLRSLTPIPATVKKETKFTWKFGDGSHPVIGEKVEHSFQKAGEFNVVLTIQRPVLKDPIVVNGKVNVRGVEPKIEVDPKSLNVFIGQPIPFTVINGFPGTNGDFPPGTKIEWDFGGQQKGTKREESVTYKEPGAKEAKVSITVPGINDPLVAHSGKITVKGVVAIPGVK
jgi:hypothetical protein